MSIHYAFDFGGVLEIDDGLIDMVRSLSEHHVVSIITAIGAGHQEMQRARIRDRGIDKVGNTVIPVYFVEMHEQAKPDGVYERQVGHWKADVMERIGATILIDDNPYVCQSVRERGLIALQYARRHR